MIRRMILTFGLLLVSSPALLGQQPSTPTTRQQQMSTVRAATHGGARQFGKLWICTADTECQPGPKADIGDVPPRREDVSTIDGMVKAWYEIVSGPKGEKRNWSRDRTLYIPGVRFVSVRVEGKEVQPAVFDHQSYAAAAGPRLEQSGFYEREIHRVTQRFGNIAHVLSTYESRENAGGPVIARGINSIEMLWDGERWWIAYAQWEEERPENPIPKELLP